MSLRYLSGTALQAALMRLGRYCLDTEEQTGREANVPHLIQRANDRFGLVDPSDLHRLTNDVERHYIALKNQETSSISRFGYSKFRAVNFLQLEDDLGRDLENLSAT